MADAALQTPRGRSLPAQTPASLPVPAWLMWTFGLAVLVTYFSLLGGFALAEPDEPRYAEISREMIELRDWVTPHLNYVKYFEKPPLVYWLTALTFKLFGMSELVVRLWPALLGVAGIAMAYALGRSMYGGWTGCVAAALLATTPFYFGLSQILILDMPLTTLMSVALAAFWFAYIAVSESSAAGRQDVLREPQHERFQSPSNGGCSAHPEVLEGCPSSPVKRRHPFVLLLYAATAAAVLIKGPVAVVLTGGIIVAFLVLQGDLAALRWLLSPVAILLFGAIALPWFVLVSHRNSEFVDFFIIKQHVDRFLRPDEHRQPLWFFVPVVFGGMLPWTLFLLLDLRSGARFLVRLVRRRLSAATLYCVIWGAVVFAFFSLSGSKLATYILPMFCPMAVLGARFFQRVMARRDSALLRRGFTALVVLAICMILGAAVSGEILDDWKVAVILPRVYIGALVLLATSSAALVLVRRRALGASFATLLFGMLVVQVVAISGRGVADQYRGLGTVLRQQAAAPDEIITYRHYVQGIPFYARRRTVMVNGRGELDFGSRQGDHSGFFWDTDAQLLDAWKSSRHVFLIINRVELEPLLSQLHPAPRQIAACGKKVIVVNFAG